MKFEWDKKYGKIVKYACIVVLFAIVCVFFLLHVDIIGGTKDLLRVFNPILYGIVIAYILNRILLLFEKKVFRFLDKKKGKMKLKRALSVLCTYIVVLVAVVVFVLILFPQVWAGIMDLKNNIPHYIAAVQKWLTSFAENNGMFSGLVEKLAGYINSFIGAVDDILAYIMPRLTGILGSVITFLKDFVLGIILSVYFLLQKEVFIAQGKRIVSAFFSEKKSQKIIKAIKKADNSFGGYIVAMAFDSLLVGIECFIICSIVGIPYYPLISLIIGVTNFIPIFGPFIGAIPSAFIVFISDPVKVIWFMLIILIIQQIDGNIIAPKIIGEHLELPSVWIVIAITLMSGIFGFIGMVIGVPLFALVYGWFNSSVEERLKKKDMSPDIIEYYSDGVGKEIEIERMEAEERKNNRPSIFARIRSMFVFIEHTIEEHKESEAAHEAQEASEETEEAENTEIADISEEIDTISEENAKNTNKNK